MIPQPSREQLLGADPPTLAGGALRLTFLRLAPGFEDPVRQSLRSDQLPYLYKQFGYFDMLSISEITSLHPTSQQFDADGVLEVLQIPCFPWLVRGKRSSFDLADIAAFPLLSVQLLKVRSLNGSLLQTIYDCLADLTNFENLPPVFSVYTTLGYNDLIIICGSDDISILTKQAAKIASYSNQSYGTQSSSIYRFSSSLTLFHVSYTQVINNRNYDQLKGEVNAEFFACVDLTQESEALRRWPRAVFGEPEYLFGPFDWKGQTPRPTPISRIAAGVLNVRRAPYIGTMTVLQCQGSDTVGAKPGDELLSSEYELAPSDQRLSASATLQLAAQNAKRVVSEFGGVDVVSTRVQDFLRISHEISYDPRATGALEDLEEYFGCLAELLRELMAAPHDPSLAFLKRQALKAELSELLRISTHAVEQRYPGIEAHLQGRPGRSVGLTQIGLNKLVLALGSLPKFLYEKVYSEIEGKSSTWTGFVAFGDEYEFTRWRNDIITCPTDVLWNPLDMWMIITHEISHGIADLVARDSRFIDKVVGQVVDNLPAGKSDRLTQERFVERIANEMVAHWIDYECFYSGDEPNFAIFVWRGLRHIPRVWWNPTEYLTRTILMDIYRSSNIDDLSDREEAIHACSISAGHIVSSISAIVDEGAGSGASQILKENSHHASALAGHLLPLMSYLRQSRASLDHIRTAVNVGSVSVVKSQLDSIRGGRPVIGGLENPLHVIRGLASADHASLAADDRWRANLALVYSLAEDHMVRLR